MTVRFCHLDTGATETTESFFFENLMTTRVEEDRPSNAGFDPVLDEGRDDVWRDANWKQVKDNELQYDEDVNQYLILTLAELANPKNLSMMNRNVVGLDSDVGQQAIDEVERARRYWLYKVNADFLLLYLGLLGSGYRVRGDGYFDKGKSYYHSAASNLRGIQGGVSGLSDVLEKLALRFALYVEILRLMKNRSDNYFSFYSRITHDQLERLESELTRHMRP